MKNEYIKPSMLAIEMESEEIIADSGPQIAGDDDKDFDPNGGAGSAQFRNTIWQ